MKLAIKTTDHTMSHSFTCSKRSNAPSSACRKAALAPLTCS